MTDVFARDWHTWREQREAQLTDPHGFLAITSLNWLSPEPERFPDAPGAWSATADGVTVELDDGEELIADGTALTGRHHFGVLAERASLYLRSGDAVIELARRGGNDILRPRRPESPLLAAHRPTPAYDPDPQWVRPGRYLPFDSPRPVTVGSVVDGLQHVYDVIGEVEFEAGGTTHRLAAYNGGPSGDLHLVFNDATSGVTTYAANRYVLVAAPAKDGSVVIDFNRSANMPCAYTDLATCPLAPATNRLTVAVEAGERIPVERLAGV